MGGVKKIGQAEMTATYDLSCALNESFCPFTSVHTPDKVDQGARVALHLRRLLLNEESLIAEGPRATSAIVQKTAASARTFKVEVDFQGGSEPFYIRGTRNCTTCCDGVHTVDLDASIDGKTWVNSTATTLAGTKMMFSVVLPAAPKYVRHTAASIFPQCALYNQEGLPALPFSMTVPGDENEYVV